MYTFNTNYNYYSIRTTHTTLDLKKQKKQHMNTDRNKDFRIMHYTFKALT